MSSGSEERLTGALQENILTLLCFDKKYASLVRYAIKPQLFESAVFREIAGIAIDFLDQFKEPVGEHLPDHLEGILNGDDSRKASTYRKLVENLFIAKDSVNGEYVSAQLQKFIRAQNLKSGIVAAVEAVEDGRIDEAEVIIQKALNSQVVTFESGINLSNPEQAMKFLDSDEAAMLTGIEALDNLGIGPARKTLFTLLAPLNRGKSWGLAHLGKWALLQQLGVLHITLEMSDTKTVGRYLQSFFSITKRQAEVRVPTMLRGRSGELTDVSFEQVMRPSLEDPGIRAYLASKVRREFRKRPRLLVKSFATGQLSINALNAYLDNLERFEKFVPDVVIIDYADLMQIDPKNRREEIGSNFINLRGIAVERNLAMITASQTNREGINAKVIDETNLSEDVSKGFTADTIITYNQTQAEHAMSLARLYVSKHRDGDARMMALITQAYAMGQFCLDSTIISPDYWDVVGIGNQQRQEPEEERPRRPQRR